MKLKICSICGKETFLWKSKPATCKNCIQHSPISRSQKPIAKLSDKRKVENRVYLTLRKIYLDNHPVCKANLAECAKVATEIHHKKGRVGDLLTDIRHFLPVCRSCHNWIEIYSREAKELGLSTSRLS